MAYADVIQTMKTLYDECHLVSHLETYRTMYDFHDSTDIFLNPIIFAILYPKGTLN